MSAPAASSQKLLQCLIRMETEERSEAKMDLVLLTNELMPKGKPDLIGVVKYPMIQELVKTEGRRKMLGILVLMVKDFCASINVVRNMNEEQMIDAAAMLLEECDNFRLEDYVMMFTMAKKGELVKIYDRIDIQLISQIMDEYWSRRREAGRIARDADVVTENNLLLENPSDRKKLVFDDKKGYVEAEPVAEIKKITQLAEAIDGIRAKLSNY